MVGMESSRFGAHFGGVLEQAETIELLDPNARLSPSAGRAEAASVNIHGVRAATSADVLDMAEVERLAFPTLFPPTRFNREVNRSNSLYLLAARDWTREELSLGPHAFRTGERSGGLRSAVTSFLTFPVRLLFQTLGGGRKKMPPQYVVGIVGLWFVMDEAHIVIIGNRPGDRRKGIGELLLIAAIEAATAKGSRVVTLEVRGSNEVARALYHKYGFREVGVRKRYYADNNEDAVIMTTPPIQSDEFHDHFVQQVREHEGRWGASDRRIA